MHIIRTRGMETTTHIHTHFIRMKYHIRGNCEAAAIVRKTAVDTA